MWRLQIRFIRWREIYQIGDLNNERFNLRIFDCHSDLHIVALHVDGREIRISKTTWAPIFSPEFTLQP